MKKISVAMTTYNGERFLAEQLDSMLTQSRPIDELVVCDDGSTDGTVDILNEFSKRAPFPVNIVVNEKNLGSTKNFEKAMSLCDGDIIALCDQDDIWLSNKIEVLEKVFTENPKCLMAFTDAMVVNEDSEPQGKLWLNYRFNRKKQMVLKRGNGLAFLLNGNVVTGATAAVSKTLFDMARPFPPELIHDHYLATIAVFNRNLFPCDIVTMNYRKHTFQQLGVPQKKNYVQRAKNVFNHDKEIRLLKRMFEKLNTLFQLTAKQKKLFTDKIVFFRYRQNIPPCVFTRVPKTIAHLLCGNYHRHAAGFLSAVKDLIHINCSQNRRL